MISMKSIGVTVAGIAVAAVAFSAAPASADPIQVPTVDIPQAWALSYTFVYDSPNGRPIAELEKGQTVAVNKECVPENWCQVWSADMGHGQNNGWVPPMTLLQEF